MSLEKKIKIGALYGRVSVDEAAAKEHGSLEQQEFLGLEFAKQLTLRTGYEYRIKYTLIEERGASGKDANRPQYQKLLGLIRQRKIDFIVAKEISRLSRSTQDFCYLSDLCRENGVAIHIRGLDLDPTTPMGEMLFKLLAVLAEFERKLIVSRVKENTRSRMLNLGHINGGRTPLGFDRDDEKRGFWTANKKELKQVEQIMEIFLEVGSFKATLDEIKRLGITNKNGSAFRFTSLKTLLTNTKYIGKMLVTYGSNDELQKCVDLPHGCVISESLFNQVKDKIVEIDGKKNLNRLSLRIYPLTGLVHYKDGSSFCGQSGTAKNGTKHFYYWNKKHKLRVEADLFEKAILDFLKGFLTNDTEIQKLVGTINGVCTSRLDSVLKIITETKREIEKFSKLDEELLSTLRNQSQAEGAAKALRWLEGQTSKNDSKKQALAAQLDDLLREKVQLEASGADLSGVRGVLGRFCDLVAKTDPVRQREFYRQIFKKIEFSEFNKVRIEWVLPELPSDRSFTEEAEVASSCPY